MRAYISSPSFRACFAKALEVSIKKSLVEKLIASHGKVIFRRIKNGSVEPFPAGSAFSYCRQRLVALNVLTGKKS